MGSVYIRIPDVVDILDTRATKVRYHILNIFIVLDGSVVSKVMTTVSVGRHQHVMCLYKKVLCIAVYNAPIPLLQIPHLSGS